MDWVSVISDLSVAKSVLRVQTSTSSSLATLARDIMILASFPASFLYSNAPVPHKACEIMSQNHVFPMPCWRLAKINILSVFSPGMNARAAAWYNHKRRRFDS